MVTIQRTDGSTTFSGDAFNLGELSKLVESSDHLVAMGAPAIRRLIQLQRRQEKIVADRFRKSINQLKQWESQAKYKPPVASLRPNDWFGSYTPAVYYVSQGDDLKTQFVWVTGELDVVDPRGTNTFWLNIDEPLQGKIHFRHGSQDEVRRLQLTTHNYCLFYKWELQYFQANQEDAERYVEAAELDLYCWPRVRCANFDYDKFFEAIMNAEFKLKP